MRAPGFWWRPPGLAAALLRPASLAYGALAARRMRAPGGRSEATVICVGDVTVGGAGKTPVALATAALLRDEGRSPAFLLRGYGGALAGPVLVDPARHGPGDVGDEALLLSRGADTVVSRRRPDGARLATSLGHDVIVMDDGLQNPSLAKDLALAVFDGEAGIGNGMVVPAGPLRAPLDAQWPSIDAAIVVGSGRAGDGLASEAASRGLPVFRAALQPDPVVAARLAGRRVLAFAGIGRPAKFFATLGRLGATVVESHAFADHHPYRESEVVRLLDRAERAGLVPVTTVKDAIRLRAIADRRSASIEALPVTLVFEEPEVVGTLLRGRSSPARP